MLHYKDIGKGLPVVLLHGFCETNEIWLGFDKKLGQQCRILVPDLPGFGRSASLQEVSIDSVARSIWVWLDEIGVSNPVIIGHSLGGYVALAMAQQRQTSLRGIGLFHSTAFPDSEEKKINRSKVHDFVKTHGVAPFIETFVPGLFYRKDQELHKKVYEIAIQTPKETLLAYTIAMRDRPSYIPFLESTQLPILIVAGEEDSIIPLTISKQLSQMAVNASILILSNVGHMGMIEDEHNSQKGILGFLKQFGEL